MVKQQSLKESSFVKSERAQLNSKTYEIKLAYLSSRLFSRSLTPQFEFFSTSFLFCFAETGTFNINDGRNANKNCLLSSDPKKRWLVRSTKPCQPALNENFNLPYGSHVKKHDTQLLIGRIAFLTCGKSDTRHLIGLHRFANENLLCGFSVCKSQYVYDNRGYVKLTSFGRDCSLTNSCYFTYHSNGHKM